MSGRPFLTDELGTGLRTAQVLGLTASAFLAGKTFAASYNAAPALLQAPAPLLAKQWQILFTRDKLLAPIISLFSSGTFACLAYRDQTWTKPAILYTTASSLLLALIPYTYLLGEPVNKKLEEKARTLKAEEAPGVKREESVHGLVDTWASVNFGRAVVSFVASAAAIWAAVERPGVVPASATLATGANRMGN
ncbi:hypothetical protein CB0940_00302 [Cercospora beticola]|uniref:DUF1772-domain-containing protein n=1 Tax=Cercospora beticola TaxID=122368 RepID=A0A2G5IA86_CERBT|nr:hypothetical protein CB0940_00302 [Cercospora beticola]PIB01393.1 hypothetical protein CB0940_00302 [Cercospora beticola]WPA95711.1 hypothetical protein RHO25_000314 [Cercospora beticola]